MSFSKERQFFTNIIYPIDRLHPETPERRMFLKAIRRPRPSAARPYEMPRSFQALERAIRGLTHAIRRIQKHIGSDPKNARDIRNRLALERKLNLRGEYLEALRGKYPERHELLKQELLEGA